MKKVIGLLTSSINAYFVKRVITGIHSAMHGEDIQLQIFEMEGRKDEAYHHFIENLSRRPELDGLIYTHLRLNPNQVAKFKVRGVPIAAVAERMEGIDWVTVDETRGGWMATRHLLAKGHRQIALVNGPGVAFQVREREQGFLTALREEGIEFCRNRDVRILNFAEDEGRDAMNMLLDLPDPPTAVFVAAGDVAALGVLKALRDRKIEVPSRVSVIGYDNLEFCSFIYPQLTSVNQPLEAMGAWAVRRLKSAMVHPEIHKCVGQMMDPELIERESVTLIARKQQLAA